MPLSSAPILWGAVIVALFLVAALAAVFWFQARRKSNDDCRILSRDVDYQEYIPPDLLPPAARHSALNDGPAYPLQGAASARRSIESLPSVRAPPYSMREEHPSPSTPLEVLDKEKEAEGDKRVELYAFAIAGEIPSEAQTVLECEAGRLAYQVPNRMWRGVEERVQVQLGRTEAQGIMMGFMGRGEVKSEELPIVETMSVSLLCERGAFQILSMSPADQLVKPDLLKGTPFHIDDFGKWVWLVTPKERGAHKLFVKVAAALKDSRGLPTTSSLPDKIFEVRVRVQVMRSILNAFWGAVPSLLWVIVTTLVGIFTKDYWWPFVRDFIGLY